MSEIRMGIHFYGRVQGVGFRYRARYLAQSLGLTGWVRNEWDGTVSMEVQGSQVLIDRLLDGISQGHYIRIEEIETEELPLKTERGFSVR